MATRWPCYGRVRMPTRPRRALVHALALVTLTGASACLHPSAAPRTLGAGQAELDGLPAELTLVCWNLHKRGGPRFDAELREFTAGAELLLVQEASEAASPWPTLTASWAWTMVIAFEAGRARRGTGVATASVVAPSRELALLSSVTEPLTNTPKSALVSWVALAGHPSPLVLVNLHGINFRPAAALDAQLHALDPVLAEHAGPLIVAGDFNTWSRDRRVVVAEFVARHRLRSAFAPSDEPRLDHVYVRGLEVRSAAVLPSRSSDHAALRVELALPPAGPGD